MTQEKFTRLLAQNRARADAIASALASASPDALCPMLREYIGCRYFLTQEEMTTDDLIALGDLSTEKLARLQRGGLQYADKNAGCTTAGSSTIKKVLLAMSLGKAIGMSLDADDVAYARTISDLAVLVQRALSGERT